MLIHNNVLKLSLAPVSPSVQHYWLLTENKDICSVVHFCIDITLSLFVVLFVNTPTWYFPCGSDYFKSQKENLSVCFSTSFLIFFKDPCLISRRRKSYAQQGFVWMGYRMTIVTFFKTSFNTMLQMDNSLFARYS